MGISDAYDQRIAAEQSATARADDISAKDSMRASELEVIVRAAFCETATLMAARNFPLVEFDGFEVSLGSATRDFFSTKRQRCLRAWPMAWHVLLPDGRFGSVEPRYPKQFRELNVNTGRFRLTESGVVEILTHGDDLSIWHELEWWVSRIMGVPISEATYAMGA